MLRKRIMANFAFAAMATVLLSAGVNAAPIVSDGSFETPVTGNYSYDPSVAGVTFSGDSGVLHNGSAFGYANAVDGTQVAFLQATPTDTPGMITQLVTGLTIGQVYTLSFFGAQRMDQNYLHETINVSVGNVLLGTYTASSTAFTQATFNFTAADASGNITFSAAPGTYSAANREYDIALDNVSVAGVPEPATWSMMLLGFGAVGYALRRQRTAAVSLG